MIGMAQTLAVYHYGYHTLKNRLVQYHEPAREPSDAEAVLEWGLNTPFTSQDKPPLAIAMVVTLNGVRSLRRYRLVIAQKSKLRLTQEVTAALASHSRDHRLTASGFFPCSIDREYLYGYAGTDIALHCGFVPPTMDLRFLSTGSGATRYTSIRPPKTGGYYSYRVSIILMLTDCNHCCCRLLLCKFT